MGRLEPGASYVYEHADGITYARKSGSVERFEIGRTVERIEKDLELEQRQLWAEIFEHAKTNEALQIAIDNVKIIYHMSKSNGKK